MTEQTPAKPRLGIDIGGTFTDFALFDAQQELVAVHKQLTTPSDPAAAVLEGVETLLAREGVPLSSLEDVVHGTTLVTNAIIERQGAVTGMLTTAGFLDALDMRHEKRYDVFDLRITFPPPIVAPALRREVNERVRYDGTVETAVDVPSAVASVAALRAEHAIEALAICFLHAYANPAHEEAVRDAVRAQFPDLYVSTSAAVYAGRREYDRFTTTTLNSFTGPMFERYLRRLELGLSELGFAGRFYVMSSSGGTLPPATAQAFPVRVVESGPAAGAQMSVFHGAALGLDAVLSFDMGGTTAKGALVRDGRALKVYELEVARQHEFKAGSGLPLRTPVLDMIEIGAGGGSIADVDGRGTIRVGPRSAGADPGPACYGRGGHAPTLTDANLVLGYLDSGSFLGGEMALDAEAAAAAIDQGVAKPLDLALERAAFGIHQIISEDVARAFRVHASERGFDYRGSSMMAFGGSGPVHAVGVAQKLGIPQVIFPVAAGVMSALGLLASPLSFEVTRTQERFVTELSEGEFAEMFAALEREAVGPLLAASVPAKAVRVVRRLDMRYHGQGHEIEVTLPGDADAAALSALPAYFRARYEALYAFSFLDAALVITGWKVEASGPQGSLAAGYRLAEAVRTQAEKGVRRAYFDAAGGYVDTPVYDRYALAPGDGIKGPALIEERESTAVIPPGCAVTVDAHLNLRANMGSR